MIRYLSRITLSLAFCATGALAQQADDIALAKETLSQSQKLSFQHDREYCGYLVLNAQDELLATKPLKGEKESCLPDEVPMDQYPIYSYHTHGAYSDEGSYELPSYSDAQSDQEEGVNGFIATPGGRLWYIDSKGEQIKMICDLNCLPSDPNFVEYDDEVPKSFYTYADLKALEEE